MILAIAQTIASTGHGPSIPNVIDTSATANHRSYEGKRYCSLTNSRSMEVPSGFERMSKDTDKDGN